MFYIYNINADKPNISERTKSQPPAKVTITKSQQQQQTAAKSITKPVDNDNEMNDGELSNNHLQEALHFKPLPSKPLPIVDEIVELEKEIRRPDESLKNPLAFKGVSLKDYESQRRMVEEQNKQKKEILYKAIEQQ